MKALGVILAVLAAAPLAPPGERAPTPPLLSKRGAASEYFDLTARFESGHSLVARFLITNEGPGEHTAVSSGRVIFPDGRIETFRNGRRKGDWQLEDDGWRLHIGSSRLDLRPPQARLEVDNDKRGIRIELELEPSPLGARSAAPGPGSYRVEVLARAARATGSLWFRGMQAPIDVRGRASLAHTWMDESESALALRRIDFAALDGDVAIWFQDLTTPEGASLRWLVIERAGEILYEGDDLDVSLRGAAQPWNRPRYPIPATLRFRNSRVDGRIELERILAHHEPLNDLPQPFRFLLSSQLRPMRVWTDSPFEVKLDTGTDRTPLQVRGTGIASVTYTNPLE